jgi:serine/threonine protein kinase
LERDLKFRNWVGIRRFIECLTIEQLRFFVTNGHCELLDGETLREKMNDGPMPQRQAIEYASQLAKGLAAEHDKGVVHAARSDG